MGQDVENDASKNAVTIEHHEPQGVLTNDSPEKSDILIDQALQGTEIEHKLETMEAARIYWKAVVLVVLLTLTIVMRGYDSGICSAFFGLPAFRNRFGKPVDGHGNQIPASWQSALGVATTVGQVFGSFAVTYPMERYGRKLTLFVCLLLTAAIIPMQAFAPSIQVLTAGEYLGGFILGAYQVLIPTYSSELLPTVLRPYLAGYINTNYNMGGFIIAGITASFDTWTTDWAFKIPFSLQWMWIVIILPALYLTPESPWWLIRKQRTEDARKALQRLSIDDPKINIDMTISMMQKTTLYEEKVETGGSVIDCFRGSARRRTEIMIMIFFCQDFSLSPVSAAYFYEQLNIPTQRAFDLNIGGTAIAFFCSVASALVLRYTGRRNTFTTGIGCLCLIQMCVGFLQLPSSYDRNKSFSTAQISLLFVAGAVYNLSIGPLTYSILTEVPSLKLRSKAVAISIATDACCGIVTNFVTPYLINPGEADAKGKVDFLWGGISVISFLWCLFRLPETKGRTFEEIDYLFEHRIPTRKFKKYVIEEENLKHNLEE